MSVFEKDWVRFIEPFPQSGLDQQNHMDSTNENNQKQLLPLQLCVDGERPEVGLCYGARGCGRRHKSQPPLPATLVGVSGSRALRRISCDKGSSRERRLW
jgi:hypothetical protein